MEKTKTYKTFDQLKEIAVTTCAAFRTVRDLSNGLLTQKGFIEMEAWDYVYDAFQYCTCDTEVIEWMRAEIHSIDKTISYATPFQLEQSLWQMPATRKFLRKYVRINFPRNLWENIDEFTK